MEFAGKTQLKFGRMMQERSLNASAGLPDTIETENKENNQKKGL